MEDFIKIAQFVNNLLYRQIFSSVILTDKFFIKKEFMASIFLALNFF